MKKTVVSEYVGFGHPDKVADQVSDALLDELLKQDPNTRAGIEVMVKDSHVILGGEVKTTARIDYDAVVRNVFAELHYPANHHLGPQDIDITNLIGQQSEEISQGVDKCDGVIGAGDQGFMVGFASNDTPDLMPLGMYVAKKICHFIHRFSSQGFGPDCKTQVIVEYNEKGKPFVDTILVSTMHQCSLEEARKILFSQIQTCGFPLHDVVLMQKLYLTPQRPKLIINPNGEWHIGGSVSDCGMTGRKIVADQFGGYCNVGGGCLHGKDMSKVDRSGAYMARYLAKNIVDAGIADTAKVELSYMIGVPQPSSINIELDRNQERTDDIVQWIRHHIDLSPRGIIQRFDGGYPRYYNTARNGHYGKTYEEMKDEQTAKLYPWEKTDLSILLGDILK